MEQVYGVWSYRADNSSKGVMLFGLFKKEEDAIKEKDRLQKKANRDHEDGDDQYVFHVEYHSLLTSMISLKLNGLQIK